MKEYDRVRLVADVIGDDGAVIPAGTTGVVVDVSPDGSGYAVDIKINGEFDNIHANPDQVEIVE
jgi:hypothetical protein